MSWVSVYLHMVFATRDREPLLNSHELRKTVFQHIKQNAEEKNILIDCVNGYREHAHCLISLGGQQTISKIAQIIKGESSFWINQNKLTIDRFEWQDRFWVESVNKSHFERVRKYIHNQEKHHAKISFQKEIDGFMEKNGWSLINENTENNALTSGYKAG